MERLSDTQRDVRLGMRLIGDLDGLYHESVARLESLMKNWRGPADVGDLDTTGKIAMCMKKTLFYRKNGLSEANYVYNLVESLHTDLVKEVGRLRERLDKTNDFLPEDDEDQTHQVLPEPRYCICNDVSYGDMIACDKENCPIEWYHLDCVGLKTIPKGSWVCPQCSV